MKTDDSRFIHVSGPTALAEQAAERIAAIAAAAIADHGYFAWALSGGNTPVPSYRLLAGAAWIGRVDWPHTHIFFADERYVPRSHPDSNYRLAYENLLQHVPIPAANIHSPIPQGEDIAATAPESAAGAYQQHLQAFFAPQRPRFDLITLGMGPDGHTASLFPGMDDCGDALVAAIRHSPKPPPQRLTLTYALINQAENLLFIVEEKGKTELLAEIAAAGPQTTPAGKIGTPTKPALWLVDRGTAG